MAAILYSQDATYRSPPHPQWGGGGPGAALWYLPSWPSASRVSMSPLTASLDGGGRCGVDVGDGAADVLCSTPLSNPSNHTPRML
jgi:hypothetical protein